MVNSVSISMPFAAPPIPLVRYGQKACPKRSLAQSFYEARLSLGQMMYRAGIDDGKLGQQIRDLNERINRATATQAPSKSLKIQQERLILQLADAALAEEGPLPGAATEYQTARKLEAAIAEIPKRRLLDPFDEQHEQESNHEPAENRNPGTIRSHQIAK